MYLRLVAIAMLIAFGWENAAAQKASGSTSYVCNFAKVKGDVKQGNDVAVQSGPGAQFRKVDKIRSGRGVYICDENGRWFKIFYSAPDGPCGLTSTNGLDVQKTKGCQSGWVEKKWIDVLSG